jgi:hypothetical protein
VVFLGGLGRSGTTLLECLLGQVVGVQALGEVAHLWKRGIENSEKCGCLDQFLDCKFWTAVGDQAFGGWQRVDVQRVEHLKAAVDRLRHVPRTALRPPPSVAEYAGYYGRVYAAAAAVSGAEVVIDSSKHPSLAHCLRHLPEVDLRVVHVVRDPRAVAHSWTKEVQRPDVASPGSGEEYMTRYSPAYCAALWTAENVAIAGLLRFGVPVHLVRYEDFVTAPEQTLRAVARFAGLPVDAELPVRGAEAVLEPTHTSSGNPIRFRTGPIKIRLDEGWRSGLAVNDRRVVEALTAPMAVRYGYLGRRRSG